MNELCKCLISTTTVSFLSDKYRTEKRKEKQLISCHSHPRKGGSGVAIVLAMEAMKASRLGVNEAAWTYGLPDTTLKDRLERREAHGTNPGPRPI